MLSVVPPRRTRIRYWMRAPRELDARVPEVGAFQTGGAAAESARPSCGARYPPSPPRRARGTCMSILRPAGSGGRAAAGQSPRGRCPRCAGGRVPAGCGRSRGHDQAACAPRSGVPSQSRTPTAPSSAGKSRAQLEAIAGVEEHADTRRATPGEDAQDGPGSCAWRRDGRDGSATMPAGDADADVVDLVGTACRVVIVDDHDALRDGHASRRPRDQRPVLDQDREVAEVQAVVEDADVPAGDRDGAAAGRRSRNLVGGAVDARDGHAAGAAS